LTVNKSTESTERLLLPIQQETARSRNDSYFRDWLRNTHIFRNWVRNGRSRSSKVVGFGKRVCNFLLVIHSSYIFPRFTNIAGFLQLLKAATHP